MSRLGWTSIVLCVVLVIDFAADAMQVDPKGWSRTATLIFLMWALSWTLSDIDEDS